VKILQLADAKKHQFSSFIGITIIHKHMNNTCFYLIHIKECITVWWQERWKEGWTNEVEG
jgi:hypothetical protein